MIRLAEAGDAPQIAAIYRYFCEESPVSFEAVGPDAAEIASRIEKIRKRLPWLVDDRDGVIAGYAYASPHRERAAYRWTVEVAIYVHENHRGTGVGRALYSELFNRLRRQGYFRALAGLVVPNPASQAFHESMGFTHVGVYKSVGYKLGSWWDTSWWQLALQPEADSPPEPALPAVSSSSLK
jgi:phosphinothricin acetyltransferase